MVTQEGGKGIPRVMVKEGSDNGHGEDEGPWERGSRDESEMKGHLTDFGCGRLEEYYRALRVYGKTWV